MRCAKCRHSWFQTGPQIGPEPEPSLAPPPLVSPPVVQAPLPSPPPPLATPAPAPAVMAEPVLEGPDPIPAPDHEEPAPPAGYQAEENQQQTDYTGEDNWAGKDNGAGDDNWEDSYFDHEPPFHRRFNRARLWMIAAVIFALAAVAAIVAVAQFGLPAWVPFRHEPFAEAQPGLTLDFPANRQDRRTLPNGSEFFGASGTVTNISKNRRTVPGILIVLRDAHQRIVYSWEVATPKRQLGPGESETINEAATDIPKSAKVAEIGWKPA